jgi:hypothetical protein
MKFAAVFALVLMIAVPARADDKPVVKADTKAAFDTIAADVRTEMGKDGRFGYVHADERAKVEGDLAAMEKLFDANGSVEKMDKPTRVELFNLQESVNAILTLRDRDRLVCERGAQPGTRIVTTNCRRYGDIEAEQQASAKFITDHAITPCNGPQCK